MTFPVQPTPCTVQSEQAVFPLTSSGQQPPTNTWCKQVMSFKHCHPDNAPVLCPPYVANRGEQNESPTSLSPSSTPTYFCFFMSHWQGEWKGAGFLSGDSPRLQVQIPTGFLSEQDHSQSTFMTIIQGSFQFIEGQFHTTKCYIWVNSQSVKLNHSFGILWNIIFMQALIF